MRFYLRIPEEVKNYYKSELHQSQLAHKHHDIKKAWYHLERAHILGQKYPLPHSYVHGRMLILALQTLNWKEIFGQLIRIPLGALFSFVGLIPQGNVGSTRVALNESMPLPKDIEKIFKQIGSP